MSKFMVWHAENKSSNGLVRHVPNSKAWAHIDASWPNSANEFCNVRLRLAADGVNPYGEKMNDW
jgi:hypothetical protein